MIYTFNGYSKTPYQMKKLLGVERWNRIIEEARKKKVLNHIFNMDVSDDVYENLKELV